MPYGLLFHNSEDISLESHVSGMCDGEGKGDTRHAGRTVLS